MSGSRLLALLGVGELTALAILAWIPEAHRFPWPGLGIFAAAFVLYAIAGRIACRGSGVVGSEGTVGAPNSGPDPRIRTVWLLAVAMRLALLPLTPELSDDVYRYLWDGHVQLSGTNPYVHAPDSPDVATLRTSWHDRINNPDVPTIYPPLAQIVFLLIALAGSSIVATKLIWLTCDLATAAVLAGIARDTGRSPLPVLLLYLWAPLLVVEVAWSGHLEPLGLLMMALAIRAAHRARLARNAVMSVFSGVTLALAALTKLAPAAALPALARRLGWRPVLGFAATGLALYLPYVGAGPELFRGLRTYGEHWWFMKGAFGIVEILAGDPARARLAVGACVLAVVAGVTAAGFTLERALLWILGAGMVLTPTLHPWYVLWMLPMAALRRSRPWLLLCGLAFIGYFGLDAYLRSGSWPQPLTARLALWVPFFLLLVWDATRRLRRRETGPEAGEGQTRIA